MPQILVFVLFFGGVYFLLLRPQQQRVKRQRELITAIGVGDRVVTAGGLIGRVVDLNEDRLLLEIADGVTVELLRLAISRRLDASESSLDLATPASDDELDAQYEEGEESVEGESGELAPGEESAALEAAAAAAAAEAELGASDGAGPAPAAHPTAGATGSTKSIEEAATPAPGQDPQ